jgi:thioredoxin-related protein
MRDSIAGRIGCFIGVALLAAAVPTILTCSDKPTIYDPQVSGIVPESIEWQSVDSLFTDYPSKREFSMLYIDAVWCSWCKVMEAETFTDTAVVRLVWQYFNPARLDLDDTSMVVYGDTVMTARQLAKYIFHVRGVPTTVILTRDGYYLTDFRGYIKANQFAFLLRHITKRD